MASGDYPDVLEDRLLISMAEFGSTGWVKIDPIVETVSFDGGAIGGEGKPVANGGRAFKKNAQEDWKIEFEGYARGLSPTSGDLNLGMEQAMYGGSDTVYPLHVNNNRNQKKYAFVFTWTTAPETGTGAITDASAAFSITDNVDDVLIREIYANARIEAVTPIVEDNFGRRLKFSLVVPAYSILGVPSLAKQDSDGSAALVVLPDYDSSFDVTSETFV